jgi:hypothetical protein
VIGGAVALPGMILRCPNGNGVSSGMGYL